MTLEGKFVSAPGRKSRAKTKFYYRRDCFCSLPCHYLVNSKFSDPGCFASLKTSLRGFHLLSGITKRRNWSPLSDCQPHYKRSPRHKITAQEVLPCLKGLRVIASYLISVAWENGSLLSQLVRKYFRAFPRQRSWYPSFRRITPDCSKLRTA